MRTFSRLAATGAAAMLLLPAAATAASPAGDASDPLPRGVPKVSIPQAKGFPAKGPTSTTLERIVARPSGKARTSYVPQSMSMRQFLAYTGSDVSSFWSQAYATAGAAFTPARQYALARGERVRTACGLGTSADGPFYCRGKVVLSMPWLQAKALKQNRDFAVAYVVAHEWAHHAQQLDGVLAAFEAKRLLSIHIELQADCLAGVWANAMYHKGKLTQGDLEEAVALAHEIADRPGTPATAKGAHGTAQQRAGWFLRGYNSGQGSSCTTW